LINDLASYELWCKKIAEEIAKKRIADLKDFIKTEEMPRVLDMAFNALLNGIYYRLE